MKTIQILFLFIVINLAACQQQAFLKFPQVIADVETQPVNDAGDAADDPAIWVNPADPEASLLICSNKKSGIAVYDLRGKLVGDYPVGKINNVDVRQGIWLNDSVQVDIAAGSNRTDNTITIMQILPDGQLVDIAAEKIRSGFAEVYGFCLYHDLANRQAYAIVNNKKGMVEQWRLFGNDSLKIGAELVRTFRAAQGQLEGCVGDDELGFLYIGEEKNAIWKFYAHPDSTIDGIKVDDLSNKALQADIEGLTIYYKENGKGYLVASSQGNDSFAVYRREGDNAYIGSFAIADGDSIDGVSDTDGIDAIALPFGPNFPEGIFIAQDGFNYDGKNSVNQNFKVVDWKKIRIALAVE